MQAIQRCDLSYLEHTFVLIPWRQCECRDKFVQRWICLYKGGSFALVVQKANVYEVKRRGRITSSIRGMGMCNPMLPQRSFQVSQVYALVIVYETMLCHGSWPLLLLRSLTQYIIFAQVMVWSTPLWSCQQVFAHELMHKLLWQTLSKKILEVNKLAGNLS